jgi:hypothetical protein
MSTANHSHKPDLVAVLHLDQLLDEALEETFPASDPVAVAVELNLSRLEASPRRKRGRCAPRAREPVNPRRL